MATKIQLRRDTAADWTSNNPTLAAGEFGWESDTNRFKIGDGATAWTSLAYASDGDTAGITFVGDDSTGTLVSQNETFKIAGTQNVTTAVSGDTLTVTGPDLSSYITASSTDTLTNKTFDANGTGNSISNIETADIAAGTLVTAAEGIGSNDNDTTIPTSAAVKAYADSVGGGGASTGDITFTGSTIQSPSNADLTFETSGTGRYVFEALPSTITGNTRNDHGVVSAFTESIDASTQTAGSDRRYYNTDAVAITLTGSGTDPDARYRGKVARMNFDPAGFSITGTSSYGSGPMGQSVFLNLNNSTGTSTVGDATGIQAGITITGAGTTTVTNAYGNNAWLENGETVTNNYLYQSWIDGNGSITNSYGFYYKGAIGGQTITNEYAFYDATNSLSVFGDIQTQAVSITDNHITTNRSNDHLHISANGTGKVNISNSDAVPEDNLVYANGFGTIDRNRGVRIWESVSAQGDMTTSTDRDYGHLMAKEWRLTAGLTSSDSDNRYRAFNSVSAVDLNGATMTGASTYSGPQGGNGNVYLDNSNASAATMSHSTALIGSVYLYPTVGAITATNTYGVRGEIAFDGSSASASGTNGYAFYASVVSDGGTTSMTNAYGVYINNLSLATNKYAFYSADDTYKSRVGTLERYREEINALTSSSTITVDCSLAPIHTVTLATDTEFNISNLGTGQSVTLIVTQDGTGTRTASFGTDASGSVKFPGGQPTLSTAGGSIDVVTIFNDGTNYLGNISQDFKVS